MSDHTTNSKPCYVYLIEEAGSGCTKIGVSVDPAARCSSLQTANPRPLLIRFTAEFEGVSSANTIEARLHAAFQEQQLMGEWFEVSADEVVEYAKRDFFMPHEARFEEVQEAYKGPQIVPPNLPIFSNPFPLLSDGRVVVLLALLWVYSTFAVAQYLWRNLEFGGTMDFFTLLVTYLGITLAAAMSVMFSAANDTALHVERVFIEHYKVTDMGNGGNDE